MMAEEDEKQKLTKTEEKESFLKQLDKKTQDLKATEERIAKLVERNEELAARSILGGKTDAGIQPVAVVVETDADYAKKVMKGEIKFSE